MADFSVPFSGSLPGEVGQPIPTAAGRTVMGTECQSQGVTRQRRLLERRTFLNKYQEGKSGMIDVIEILGALSKWATGMKRTRSPNGSHHGCRSGLGAGCYGGGGLHEISAVSHPMSHIRREDNRAVASGISRPRSFVAEGLAYCE